MSSKKEFGDFQTPKNLAARSVSLVKDLFGVPDLVIEPTAGLGAFLDAAVDLFGEGVEYKGYEINQDYVNLAKKNLGWRGVEIFQQDFFVENWRTVLNCADKEKVLVIGNPPWVTNSALGQLGSSNLPQKTNFKGLKGFEARTGKSNFDIAEWMLIRLIEVLPETGAIAVLCKTMTARKVLKHFWKMNIGWEGVKLFHIDAKAEFDVAVDACLFYMTGKPSRHRVATLYPDLDINTEAKQFGFVDGDLVSDIDSYQKYKSIDGGSASYVWRSGVKHDAAKIMEFDRVDRTLLNGLGEIVELEDQYVFPLLKSSDLGNGRVLIRKSVLVTQRLTGDTTRVIETDAPKTWAYLTRHADILDGRKSSIYKKRSRFSVFGIGPYSYSPWKVAISGLYKNFSFVVLSPTEGKPVMVDDTCYSIPCQSEEEAILLQAMLSSDIALNFLRSLVFIDSKRPITIDVLRRISFVNLARALGRLDELEKFMHAESKKIGSEEQLMLLMEPDGKYRTQ